MSLVKHYQQFMASHAVSSAFSGEEAAGPDDSVRFKEILEWDAKLGKISYTTEGNVVKVWKTEEPSAPTPEPEDHGIHPAPLEFSADQIIQDPILRFFHYAHLPIHLRARSHPFCQLAMRIISTTPRNAERSVALRKLLEAKDAAVRAALPVN